MTDSNCHVLYYPGVPNIKIRFYMDDSGSTRESIPEVVVLWCRTSESGIEKREPIDIIDWYDEHNLCRTFEPNRNGRYSVDDARDIWDTLVQHHNHVVFKETETAGITSGVNYALEA